MASILDILKRKGSHGNNIAEAIENLPEGSGGVPEAPEDDKIYGRKNKEWTEVGGGGTPVPCSYTIDVMDMDADYEVVKTLQCNGYVGQIVNFEFATLPTVHFRTGGNKAYTLMNLHDEAYKDFVAVIITEDGQKIEVDAYDVS